MLFYGLSTLVGSLYHVVDFRGRHIRSEYLHIIPMVVDVSFIYLGILLRRFKYNAWLAAIVLSILATCLELYTMHAHESRFDDNPLLVLSRIVLPVLLGILLYVSRSVFIVRSDVIGFRQAVRLSGSVLIVALAYGVFGFMMLDTRDFHQTISLATSVRQTVDQFGLTTNDVIPHTARARLFVDSLWLISWSAIAYTIVAFFQPIRTRLLDYTGERVHAQELLNAYPSDIDDFFKIWPHDKHYFFETTRRAGLAYKVSRGVALVVSDPFGDSERFSTLVYAFEEFCFVNDWLPSFVHVGEAHRKLYERHDYRLQKIGEEAIIDVRSWPERQTGKSGKYFREIRNRFVRLGYTVEVVSPPHTAKTLDRLRAISEDWLSKPGREERGFMLGYHDEKYLQTGSLVILRDERAVIQGFMNLIPTYEPRTANYDLLRCSSDAPGNSSDYLAIGALDWLYDQGYESLNMGLAPLAGLNDRDSQEKSVVNSAMRFVYSNGGRFYSFSGLYGFKDKYRPSWQPRYIAYQGGIRNFTRTLTALNRAMKIK